VWYWLDERTGNGAPPLVQKRRLLKLAVFQLGAWVSIWYMVGTPAKTVTRSRFNEVQHLAGLKLARQDAGVPKTTWDDM